MKYYNQIAIDLINPPPREKTDQECCDDCIHSNDAEIHCIIRRCIHAVNYLYDCYEKRGDEND